MALYKEPQADLRHKYGRYIQYGLIVSLALMIAAFTVPMDGSDEQTMMTDETEVIEIEDIEQTVEVQPPPPPPPAPPPPQEVPDDVEVETIIEDIDLDLNEVATPPPAPPAPPPAAPPPPTPNAPPPPPPPPDPEPTEPEIFEVVEQQPELIGGLEGLARQIQYPEMARRANVEGTVLVQFVVDERGQVTDPVILRTPNAMLSDEALRVVRQARFQPGQQRGRPVKVRFTLPVRFALR